VYTLKINLPEIFVLVENLDLVAFFHTKHVQFSFWEKNRCISNPRLIHLTSMWQIASPYSV